MDAGLAAPHRGLAAELAATRARLDESQAMAHIGSWEWDIVADAISWTDELYRIFGLTPHESPATYALWLARLHPDDRALADGHVQEAFRTGGSFAFTHRIVRPDGSLRVLQAQGATSVDAEGRVVRMHGTSQDVTDRQRVLDALEARNRDLERSNEDLERFAYAASHDLREPLAVVGGYLDLIEPRLADGLDDPSKRYVASAKEAVLRMQALIADLLAFSRVGTQGRPFADVDSGKALADALSNIGRTIEEAGATVVVRGALPTVHGDSVQLTQVFQNLIGNAIKFRSDRPPRVEVAADRRAGAWEFAVADNGIGIDAKDEHRLFVIFQRLHGERYPGTGMGLALCKRILERHGGRIWAEPRPGGGTVFRFTVPEASA